MPDSPFQDLLHDAWETQMWLVGGNEGLDKLDQRVSIRA
jgi:hypothetical protein